MSETVNIRNPYIRNLTISEALLHRAAFGSEHGSPKHGINNVHAIVQGKLGLKSADGHHEITATHTYSNKGGKGKLPSHVGGMVSARYMGGRKNQWISKYNIYFKDGNIS